jgi:ABC-type Na+ efflux pump permease subunit
VITGPPPTINTSHLTLVSTGEEKDGRNRELLLLLPFSRSSVKTRDHRSAAHDQHVTSHADLTGGEKDGRKMELLLLLPSSRSSVKTP